MKKIIKQLLASVLTIATVFTALPATQVFATEQVYTDNVETAGRIVKIDNNGIEVSSFEESWMKADGQTAYCIDINTGFHSGYKTRIDASSKMTDEQIADVALSLEYVKQYAKSNRGQRRCVEYVL